MTIRVLAALAPALTAGLLLTACDPSAAFRKTNTETLEAGFLPHSPDITPAPPTFCYQTLAYTDCYDRPQPGEGGRLVESYPPRRTLPQDAIR
ncbi:MAG: hypothetical protein IRY94_04860 [Rhodospirillaceae bacterium]|nr:hypothetical protein [Rhodospirillaceae bacterium]